MPSVEGRGGQPTQPGDPGEPQEPNKEQEQPYYLATRFKSALPAKIAYGQAQELIFNDRRTELSVYRFLLDRISHIAVIGQPPPEDTEQQLQKILSYGEPATLPPDILEALRKRRAEMKQRGEWVEGHYRPGKKLDY